MFKYLGIRIRNKNSYSNFILMAADGNHSACYLKVAKNGERLAWISKLLTLMIIPQNLLIGAQKQTFQK